MMPEAIQSLLATLQQARYFEDAAEVVLRGMLKVVEEVLAASPYAKTGRLLRGMIYLRPDEAYRGLAVVDLSGGKTDNAGPLHASATAWRSLQEHRCAVSIDIATRTIQPHRSDAAHKVMPAPPESSEGFNSQESQQRFLGREATHVCVLPLRSWAGHLDGMVSLEASCPASMGRPFIWKDCEARLQLLSDVSAPYLTGLAPRTVKPTEVDEFLPVVGSAMGQMLPMLRMFAHGDETLLISGPTGAGKSRLARWCHQNSPRKQNPFEVLDLTTVPEELQNAEIFGWKKGAFTNAVRDTLGSVARAEGGTLFIDEIDKLSKKVQASLLYLLEERTYRPLGDDSKDRRANVRFIIGTNVDLRKAVEQGRFREDLYYRINVLPIKVPPLDERQDEIPLWAEYMVNRCFRERMPGGQARLAPEAQRRLSTSRWPGNLRQLDNIVRRSIMVAMTEQTRIGARDVSGLMLEERHIAEALGLDPEGAELSTVLKSMRTAALAFFHEARQRGAMDLDLADAFRGFVLGVASQQVGREEAMRLFGLDAAVKNRNHHRILRRELDRVLALYEALGSEPDSLVDQLKPESEP
ncbi:sigma 54-interacting transcriptional regulator [Hyalangium minutum]|uniref:NtrC n=1 Tax=Hyalangium minutum TaxID=394096 RepID=A0A085W4Q9_9BACT|nr:sigma 54-interacting transcriptional regulator [Hyalangium minutum]KFE62672.1 NtrC [Hyalangium minutum]